MIEQRPRPRTAPEAEAEIQAAERRGFEAALQRFLPDATPAERAAYFEEWQAEQGGRDR